MARVLLVDPPGWQGAAAGNRPFANVGLAYLVPALRAGGHEPLLADLNNTPTSDEQFAALLGEFVPQVIGFSVKTATAAAALRLARVTKETLPTARTVAGGPHTTVAGGEVAAAGCFDAIFVGEAEEQIGDLVRRLALGDAPQDVPGVLPPAAAAAAPFTVPLVADLDSLAFPDYTLFPQIVRQETYASYPLVTSRGCVYGCTYCSVPRISGPRFRKRSPESVIEELRRVQADHGTHAFEIIDDTFNFDVERCKEICRQLLATTLEMTWACPNGVRADRVDPELAELMYRSGCRAVMVGVESADPAVLAAVKKGETIEDIERGIRTFQAAGIGVGGFFMIGLPGDSYRSQERSVEFARRLGLNAHFNMLVPYPGTALWDWAQQNATFLQDFGAAVHFSDSAAKVKPVLETAEFPAAERQRAYEMVHTRLRQFALVIPGEVSGLRRRWELVRLLLKYDAPGLVTWGLQRLAGKLRALRRRKP